MLMVIILNAKEVKACSVCIVAAMDKVLPPIYVWCLIAISWFLLNSLVSALYRTKISFTPDLIEALIVFVICVILGGAFLGPLPILALAITPTITFLVSFTKTNKGNWKNNPYYGIQFVGFAAAIAITITSYHTYQILQNRTLVHYIVQWPGAGISSVTLLEQLKEKEPASLDDYRYILEHGKGFILIRAAERVAIIGDPENDSKILEKTIERLNKTSDADITPQIKKSLQDLRLRYKQK
jgi:hypothetical protein